MIPTSWLQVLVAVVAAFVFATMMIGYVALSPPSSLATATVATKADRLEIKPVATIQVVPQPPSFVPLMMPELPPIAQSVPVLPETEPMAPGPPMSAPTPRVIRYLNLCARHGLHKVWTRGGRSWHCQR